MPDYLHREAIAKTGPGETYGTGRVIACCDAPMVCIETENGERFWWRVDLCEFTSVRQQQEARLGALERSQLEAGKPV